MSACSRLPSSLALTAEQAQRHSRGGALLVGFTDQSTAPFALNWASQLHSLALPSLVGISTLLSPTHEAALRAVGAHIFCADGNLMSKNPQAGRWAEVAPLLRFGLHVLLSDVDVAWMRNPLPYFSTLLSLHPALDLLLCSDKVFNGYNRQPIPVVGTLTELDLEDGMSETPSAHL